MRQKERNFQVASAPHYKPEVLLPSKVRDSTKAGLEVVFEEEEVLNRGDRDPFPLVEVVMVLGKDLEAIL